MKMDPANGRFSRFIPNRRTGLFVLALLCAGMTPGYPQSSDADACAVVDSQFEADRRIDVCTRYIASRPSPEELIYALKHRAQAWLKKRDYDRAILDISEALRVNTVLKDNTQSLRASALLTDRGVAYYLKGDYDHAIPDLDAAMAIDSGNQVARRFQDLAQQKKTGH